MANIVMLVGNLTDDVRLRHVGADEKAVAEFSVACKRPKKDAGADFPSVIVWGKMAESCAKYLGKGSRVCVEGSIQTGSYKNQEGKNVYTTKVLASKVEFLSDRKQGSDGSTFAPEGFAPVSDNEDMPF